MQERRAIIRYELDYISTKLARAPYLTQFIQAPYFRPIPQVNLAAAGHVYRAFGHITHRANENEMLDILF